MLPQTNAQRNKKYRDIHNVEYNAARRHLYQVGRQQVLAERAAAAAAAAAEGETTDEEDNEPAAVAAPAPAPAPEPQAPLMEAPEDTHGNQGKQRYADFSAFPTISLEQTKKAIESTVENKGKQKSGH